MSKHECPVCGELNYTRNEQSLSARIAALEARSAAIEARLSALEQRAGYVRPPSSQIHYSGRVFEIKTGGPDEV